MKNIFGDKSVFSPTTNERLTQKAMQSQSSFLIRVRFERLNFCLTTLNKNKSAKKNLQTKRNKLSLFHGVNFRFILKQTHQKLKYIFVEVKYHEGIEMYSFIGLKTQGVTFF